MAQLGTSAPITDGSVSKFCFLKDMVYYLVWIVALVVRHRRFIVFIRADKIGHLALHTPVLLDEMETIRDLLSIPRNRKILLVPDSYVCNLYVWELLSASVNDDPRTAFLLRPRTMRSIGGHEARAWTQRAALYMLLDRFRFLRHLANESERTIISTPSLWVKSRASTALLSGSEKSPDGLPSLGLSQTKPLVVVIDRDSAYFSETHKNPRDTSIVELGNLITVLLSREYQVVRLGSVRKQRIPITSDYFLDYPFYGLQSDVLDIEILRCARFVIGWNTGLTLVPYVMGVPTCYVHPGTDAPFPNMFNSYLNYREKTAGTVISAWEMPLLYGTTACEDIGADNLSQYEKVPVTTRQWQELVGTIEVWVEMREQTPQSLAVMGRIQTAVRNANVDLDSPTPAMWSALDNSWGCYFHEISASH
jgi:hypothetical protein